MKLHLVQTRVKYDAEKIELAKFRNLEFQFKNEKMMTVDLAENSKLKIEIESLEIVKLTRKLSNIFVKIIYSNEVKKTKSLNDVRNLQWDEPFEL